MHQIAVLLYIVLVAKQSDTRKHGHRFAHSVRDTRLDRDEYVYAILFTCSRHSMGIMLRTSATHRTSCSRGHSSPSPLPLPLPRARRLQGLREGQRAKNHGDEPALHRGVRARLPPERNRAGFLPEQDELDRPRGRQGVQVPAQSEREREEKDSERG